MNGSSQFFSRHDFVLTGHQLAFLALPFTAKAQNQTPVVFALPLFGLCPRSLMDSRGISMRFVSGWRLHCAAVAKRLDRFLLDGVQEGFCLFLRVCVIAKACLLMMKDDIIESFQCLFCNVSAFIA